MPPRLPQVGGRRLVKLLQTMGYEVTRQRGSHVRLRKTTCVGVHKVTIPLHASLAKGTLNDILTDVALWNGTPKERLIDLLRRGS